MSVSTSGRRVTRGIYAAVFSERRARAFCLLFDCGGVPWLAKVALEALANLVTQFVQFQLT